MIYEKNIKANIRNDKIFRYIVVFLSFLSMVPLFLILGYILIKGLPVIFHWYFLSHSVPSPIGTVVFHTLEGIQHVQAVGGVLNAMVGTLILVVLSAIIAIPLGVIVGIYLAENQDKKFAAWATVSVDMIQGIPSIIFGIVVNLWLVRTLKGYSALSGGVALGLMMLPLIIKNTEETLKLIPAHLKEAALALGTPYYRMILKIALPVGLSGIMTGVLVALARVMGETAPLLFTSFGNRYLSWDITGPVEALPHIIYKFAMSPYPNWVENSWGASALLVLFVLLFNIITKVVVSKWKVKF